MVAGDGARGDEQGVHAAGAELHAELLGERGEGEFAGRVGGEETGSALAGQGTDEHEVAAAVEEIGCEGLRGADGGEEVEFPKLLEFFGGRGDGVAAHRAAGGVGDEVDAAPALVDRDREAFDVGGAGDVGWNGENFVTVNRRRRHTECACYNLGDGFVE
jgi:hypothetical protein